MTLDEAIARAREVAERQRKDNEDCIYKVDYGCKGCADYYSKPCVECAKEHEQLVEWLEELKERRKCELCAELSHCFDGKRRIAKCDKFSPKSEKNSFFNFDEVLRIECEKARSKAIDDIVIKIKERVGMDWEWDFIFIEQIAEQLKKEVEE